MKSLSNSEWAILVFIVVYSFIPTFGGLVRVFELAGGPAIAPFNPRAIAVPLPIILHLLGSFVFCLLGAIQFIPSIRRTSPALHRKAGRLVAVSGLLAALTGLWMTHFYTFPAGLQGSLLYWARIVLGSLMAGLIVHAIIAIRGRKVARHSASMLRAYAIGQGASTQAFIGIGWIILTGSEAVGAIRDVMMVSAWVLNLLVAEALIRSTLKPIRRHSTGSQA